MDLGTIGVIGLVLSLLSIPFLSNSITMSAISDYKYPVAGILNETDFDTQDAQKYPGTAEKTFGPKIFSYKTDTSFGSFELTATNDGTLKISQSLTNPELKIERIIINNNTLEETWVLTTNTGILKSTKNFNVVKEEFSTPAGSCFKEENMGEITEYCTGQIHKIDGVWEKHKDLMAEWSEKLANISSNIELPNIKSTQWNY